MIFSRPFIFPVIFLPVFSACFAYVLVPGECGGRLGWSFCSTRASLACNLNIAYLFGLISFFVLLLFISNSSFSILFWGFLMFSKVYDVWG